MKSRLLGALNRIGVIVHSPRSLPTGVDWLLDIQRAGKLGPRPVCLDVGANEGQTVAQLRARFPGARVHAFEPFAGPRRALMQTWGDVPGVTVVPLALGAQPGRVQARPHAQSVRSSLRDRVDSGGESIEIDTVDGYCERAGLEGVDILKTDTEGWDLQVLQGAERLLASSRIGFVYAEVTPLEANGANTPLRPVLDCMAGWGYRLLGLYETYPLHHYAEPNVFCNALFAAPQRRRVDGPGVG